MDGGSRLIKKRSTDEQSVAARVSRRRIHGVHIHRTGVNAYVPVAF